MDPPEIEDAVEASLPAEDEVVHEAEVAQEVEEVHDTDDKPLPTFTVCSTLLSVHLSSESELPAMGLTVLSATTWRRI